MSELRNAILRLHHSEMISGKEIARRLGCTDAYVSVVLARAGVKKPANRTRASLEGGDLKDPNRADRLLRRFSWESER